MVTASSHVAVSLEGQVLASLPPRVAAYLVALARRGVDVFEAGQGRRLPVEVAAVLMDLSEATRLAGSRHDARSEVKASRQLRDGASPNDSLSLLSMHVTIQEAAEMLNLSESTVLRRCAHYGAEKSGRQWLLDRALVEADRQSA